MGILNDVGQWGAENLPKVVEVVKKAAKLVGIAASVVDALLKGKTIFSEDENPQTSSPQKKTPPKRPDIMGQSDSQSRSSDIYELQQSIDQSKKKLTIIEEKNELEHRRIQLQIDVMELVVSSSTFERFSNNIDLHAANLQIHLQAIQNTAGLLGDVNRQRTAIKALMSTVNHLVNVLGVGDRVDKIEGLDIDIHPGSISILGAYDAFQNTRRLLLHEIDSFSEAIQEQLERVENVRSAARHIPGISQKVSSWLEESVEPKLIDAKTHAKELRGGLIVMPRLEKALRQELKSVKQDAL